jgi:F0F1-type ATP synthase beta subunit
VNFLLISNTRTRTLTHTGKYVDLDQTVEDFARVCDGEFDHLPEAAFYMQGGLDDVQQKVRVTCGRTCVYV